MANEAGVRIEGFVFAEEGDLDHDVFLDEFILFVEAKGWNYFGFTKQIRDGEEIDDLSESSD